MQRYKDYGITIYHPNYEVWDKRLFELICPGKERYVGREEWHRRIFDAAEVFGARYVIPNFVAGVEMAKPFGFATVDEAIASHDRGARLLHEPRASRPASRPGARSRRRRSAATTRTARRSSTTSACSRPTATTMERHGLKPPPGYGVAGAGNAVFSVSSFMDTLAPEVSREERCRHEPDRVDEARELWHDACDEELKRLAQAACARAGTSRTARPTW